MVVLVVIGDGSFLFLFQNFQQPKDTTRLDETMYVRLLLPELCKVTVKDLECIIMF